MIERPEDLDLLLADAHIEDWDGPGAGKRLVMWATDPEGLKALTRALLYLEDLEKKFAVPAAADVEQPAAVGRFGSNTAEVERFLVWLAQLDDAGWQTMAASTTWAAAGDAAWSAGSAARDAAGDAAWSAARDAAGDAAWSAARYAGSARHAAEAAACALAARPFIGDVFTQAHFDLLIAPAVAAGFEVNP